MSKSSKSSSKQVTNQQQTTVTPGTSKSAEFADKYAPSLAWGATEGNHFFEGSRIAVPKGPQDGNWVAQWGAAPDTFVAQQTATAAPTQAMVTHVDPNAQEGIDAGMAAAADNQTQIAGITPKLFDHWKTMAEGPGQTPGLEDLINYLNTSTADAQQRTFNQMDLTAGAQGAFGGIPMQQQKAFAAQQYEKERGGREAELRYTDYNNWLSQMQAAPEQVAQVAALNQLPAEQFAYWGGQRQQNLAAAAAAGDENAQRLLNNQWQAQQLNDVNAQKAADEAVAQWEAQYRIDDAATRNQVKQAEHATASEQALKDDHYLKWLNQQEYKNQQIAQLLQIQGMYNSIPGTSSTLDGTTTTTSKQTTSDPVGTIAGLASAGMQMFAPGGFFAGSLAGATGALNKAGSGTGGLYAPAPMPAWQPYQPVTL